MFAEQSVLDVYAAASVSVSLTALTRNGVTNKFELQSVETWPKNSRHRQFTWKSVTCVTV